MKKLKKLTMFFISQFLVLFFVIPVWGGGDTGVEKLFVVTTDYSTGSYSTVNLTDWSADSSIGSIHSDAIAQYYRGKIYVINRLYGDNIMVFSTADLTSPILQFSTGALSNPYYMAFLNEEKAYVTLYEETDLLVVNPSTGAEITRIDLSSYADADGIPEMSSMVMLNGKLFVAIQRLDRNNFLSPTDYSQVVVVDTQTDTVLQSVTLTGKNPIAMSYNPVMDKILVSEAGSYGVTDGGVETIHPVTFQAEGYRITEAVLGGDLAGLYNPIALVSESKGYALISDTSWNTSIVKCNIDTGVNLGSLDAPASGFSHADLNLVGKDLVFAYRPYTSATGLRIFDTGNDSELTISPIDTGLPPSCMTPMGVDVDFNHNGEGDVNDIMQIASCWGSIMYGTGYIDSFDMDQDGDIDTMDIMTVASYW